MEKLFYKTSELAKAANIHSNTVRLYESWGYISPVGRRANGYRQYERLHFDQVLLVRKAINFTWFRGKVRNFALEIILKSAQRNFILSYENSLLLIDTISQLIINANEAIEIVHGWINNKFNDSNSSMVIGVAAKKLNVSTDTIRNWERNGLLKIPRAKLNGYRQITIDEFERLKVIKVLRTAGFSMMSILRMFRKLDSGSIELPEKIIDTPGENEDIVFATDTWLSKLNQWMELSLEIEIQLSEMKKRYKHKIN